jgi:hypothetical protein
MTPRDENVRLMLEDDKNEAGEDLLIRMAIDWLTFDQFELRDAREFQGAA